MFKDELLFKTTKNYLEVKDTKFKKIDNIHYETSSLHLEIIININFSIKCGNEKCKKAHFAGVILIMNGCC